MKWSKIKLWLVLQEIKSGAFQKTAMKWSGTYFPFLRIQIVFCSHIWKAKNYLKLSCFGSFFCEKPFAIKLCYSIFCTYESIKLIIVSKFFYLSHFRLIGLIGFVIVHQMNARWRLEWPNFYQCEYSDIYHWKNCLKVNG